MTNTFIDCIRKCTSRKQINRGMPDNSITTCEMNAFLCLDIATSIMKFNELKNYWSSKIFRRSIHFKNAISRKMFLNIRSCINIYPEYDQKLASVYPVFYSQNLLQSFAQNAAYDSVPTGVSTIDENTIRCKGQTSVQTYFPLKPIFGFTQL